MHRFFYNDNNVLGDLMKNFKYFAQSYVDWVIRLGRLRFSLLGVMTSYSPRSGNF